LQERFWEQNHLKGKKYGFMWNVNKLLHRRRKHTTECYKKEKEIPSKNNVLKGDWKKTWN
jgi:hypothetical protein